MDITIKCLKCGSILKIQEIDGIGEGVIPFDTPLTLKINPHLCQPNKQDVENLAVDLVDSFLRRLDPADRVNLTMGFKSSARQIVFDLVAQLGNLPHFRSSDWKLAPPDHLGRFVAGVVDETFPEGRYMDLEDVAAELKEYLAAIESAGHPYTGYIIRPGLIRIWLRAIDNVLLDLRPSLKQVFEATEAYIQDAIKEAQELLEGIGEDPKVYPRQRAELTARIFALTYTLQAIREREDK